MTRSAAARLAGLDGLRAVAVLLVVVYHLFPGLAPSGFLGVDVFFVLSGFLITTLLLRERESTGRIALGDFWRRRARRLLPAIATMVLVCATAAWMVGGDVLVGLGTQIVGAAAFAYNWVALAGGSSYFGGGSFEATSPELLRNLWSLAVEEQFYLLWPLLLPAVLLLRRWRIAVAVALAAASTLWSVALLGDGVTRVYYGTDTHAYGLLLGVALAFARPASRRRGVPAWAGALAVIGLVALAALPSGTDAATFPGLLLAASALTVIAIAAAVRPGGRLGRVLDVAPMRWVGERSFGIYLWHWPIVVLLTSATTGGSPDIAVPVGVGLLTLGLSLLAAELSYRFIEQPIRRRGLRGAVRTLDRALRGRPARRFAAVAAAAAGALVIAGTAAAVTEAPAMASGESVVAHGQAALDAASAAGASRAGSDPTAAATPGALRSDVAPLPPPCPTVHLAAGDPTCVAPDGRPVPPAPAPVSGARISAVGDSVMLASAPALLERMPGIDIDAKVSRSLRAGTGIVDRLETRGELRDYVVIGLGTNGAIDARDLRRIRKDVGPDRTLVLVNAFAPRDWIPGVNKTLTRFADETPGVVVADWSGGIGNRTELLAGDRIHPGAAGGRVYAKTVGTAIEEVENSRAELRYRIELAQWSVADTFAAGN